MSDAENLVRQARAKGVELVRFYFCDSSGILRGKVSSLKTLPERLVSGIGVVKGSMAQNLLDQLQTDTGLGAVGEVRLMPDTNSFTALPYTQASAAMFCRMEELSGQAWSHCSRSFLERQVEEARKMGFSVKAAFEPEFIVGEQKDGEFRHIDKGLCFSSESMDMADGFITEVVRLLTLQGLDLEQYYPELGPGQHELSIAPASPLSACDRYLLLKETVKACAASRGLHATFTPKRSVEEAGNGCHLHLSLYDESGRVNQFFHSEAGKDSASGQSGLSKTAMHFIAGVHSHLKALVSLTCPSVNSYKRLRPHSWSSAFTAWGYENREAAIRVPSVYRGRESDSTNIEIKCVDSTANPYLALGAILACGLDGIKRLALPPAPVEVDPADLDDAGQKFHGVEPLPRSLNEALTELEADLFLMNTLGKELANTYIIVKTSEAAAFEDDPAFSDSVHRARY
ncbi:MAG: glutamine synthetase family protein [Candidatus Melainabacteria bacterium]|nr:glutamine synthetase family protein [Candidatus Melainabacteria bacterium]